MALSVQSLFNSTADLYRLKLLAGKKGLHHPVSWMYYSEDTSTIDFIRGGELVLTTGMNMERTRPSSGGDYYAFTTEYLTELVTCLHDLDAAGLIVNVGRYVMTIPEEVTQLCDSLKFPLFSMPWEIHIVDIMQDYGNRIVRERQRRKTLGETFYNALFCPAKFSPSELADTSFNGALSYGVVILELPDELFLKSDDDLARYIDYSLNARVDIPQSSFCWFLHDRKIVYVVRDDPQAAGFAIGRATSTDRYLAPMKIGVSDSCDSPASLSRAYSHAAFALSLGDNPAGPSFYGELGVFRLLAEIGDRSVLERYQEETLGKLSVLDGDKRADYLKTLRLYLENDGSVAETALENYTHRNTVNYRIRKIRDILGVDLNDADTRYRLRTVLYIREFLDKTRE
jgi:hypothetical protein